MDSDTPEMESGAQSDPVAGFEALLGKSWGDSPAEKAPPSELELTDELEIEPDKPEADQPELDAPEAKTYRVTVDGKDIELTAEQVAESYKNGLRQSDYTKKTMAASEEVRAAQAERAQIAQERAQYQSQLNQLTNALGEQLSRAPDWNALLENDPVEYLKQQHLYQTRQAAFQSARQEQAQHAQQTQAQAAWNAQQMLSQEREQLLAILPAWADEAKAQSEKAAIVKHLVERGYSPEQVSQLSDHKTVVMAREAMLYRQMMAKAKETAKAVEKLPPRMEKPGVSRPTDGRTADMQALRKSGKAEDAAALFAKMF